VRAAGEPAWGDVALEERAVIGALEGPDEYIFGWISDVALGPDHTVYVADIQVPVVRRYSPEGDYLGDVGKRGQGPGEYLQVTGLETLPDGRLAVWDPMNRRVSLFHPDGSFAESFRVEAGFRGPDPFEVDVEGRLYVKDAEWVGEPRRPRPFWLRFAADGELLDTVPIPPENGSPSYVLITSQGPRRPFPTRTVSALTPEGSMAWGRTDEYAIYMPRAAGSVLRIERPYEPVPVKRAERRQWEHFTEQFATRSEGEGRPFERPSIPDTKPPFRDFLVDAEGRIWVSVYTEGYEAELSEEYLAEREGRAIRRWREMPEWEVLSPEGRFLGRVSLPASSQPYAARGNALVTVRRGEWDESYVVLYDLPG
jgi:hypothetical protein